MHRVLLLLLAAVLLLAPLTGVWQADALLAVLQITPLFALCLWFLTAAHRKHSLSFPPGTSALICLIVWGGIQLVPLPPFLVKTFSPNTWQIYQQGVEVLSPSAWIPLSLHPRNTLQALITLCAVFSVYFLTVFLQTDRSRLKLSVLWLVGTGGGLSIGVIGWCLVSQFFSPNSAAGPSMAVLSGLDAGSFGLLLLLLGPLAVAALLAFRPTARYGSFKERIAAFWQATVRDHFFVVLLSAVIIPFGLAFLHWPSLFLYFATLPLLWLMLAIKKKGHREAGFFLLFMTLILPAFFIGLHRGDPETRSLRQNTLVAGDQSVVEKVTKNFIMVGAGFGTYEDLFRRYDHRPEEHRFPIQKSSFLLRGRTTGGLLGAVLGLWFAVSVFRYGYSQWRSRRNKLAIYFFAGSFSGLLAFTATIFVMGQALPAWLWYYVFSVAGLLVAASRVSSREPNKDEFTPAYNDWRRIFSCVLAAGLVLLAVYFNGGRSLAKGLYRQSQLPPDTSTQTVGNTSERRLLSHAIIYDPLEASYRWASGWNFLRLGLIDNAMDSFAGGLRLQPLAGEEIYRLGIYLIQAGHQQQGFDLLRQGLQNDWNQQSMQFDYVTRLLRRNWHLEAGEHIRQILTAAPSRTSDWVRFLDQRKVLATYGTSILADHPRCFLDYADFLLQKGEPEQAAATYSVALNLIQDEKVFAAEIIWRLVRFFETRQKYEEALTAVLAGIRMYPENLDFMKTSGRLYKSLGLTYKAMEVYRQILILSPQDKEIRRQLMELDGLRH